ncbi:MAG: carboxylating nicotinate-nucleotide diphosphorylase [Bacteroidota bacterium]
MNIDSITLRLIHLALEEDLGSGDITTRCVVPDDAQVKGQFIAKESGVICGLEIVRKVFALLDEMVILTLGVKDGDEVSEGTVLAEVSGPAHAILSGERVALNFLQRLSAIATKTSQLATVLMDTKLKIVDTRKTTPGMRVLEKYAVRCGGGFNHRMNLSDGVLIKDNHIKAAGGIIPAVKAARQNAPQTLKVEVETETLEQVQQALDAGADIIMLDNMDVETMAKAVTLVNGRALTEASGNMDQKDLLQVARAGVDLVSVGALTHSVKALDISLKFL